MSLSIALGDCRALMPALGPFDLIVADPPYSATSLAWDKRVDGWLEAARASLKPTGSVWLFGSMRSLMGAASLFPAAGFRLAQDIVWEKHNGSSLLADRFRRVHEHVVQFYRDDSRWGGVFNDVQKTLDATARTVRTKNKPPHMNAIKERTPYVSTDGGPRLMRSVIRVRSCHHRAIHPTEKPVKLLDILVRTSCPPGGLVGDFFAGSGAAGEACWISGREYQGCENDAAIYEAAKRRLDGLLPRVAA